MNIRKLPPYLTDPAQNSSAAAGKTGAQEKAPAVNSVSSDRVELSKDYQDLAQAQKTIAGTDEVRTGRVQQIKNQLKSGTYEVKPVEIANKMLDEII